MDMPRKVRKACESGIYHVMLRGINRQRIFEDEWDYRRFKATLVKYREISGYALLCYCLMPNHVHLLIKEGDEPLSTAFRRIGASYVYWYNGKYGRAGHLFQDRYRSETVDNEAYLLTVARYIHQNPVKAGLCKKPGEYPYSSYRDYISDSGITDRGLLLGMMGRDAFIAFNEAPADDRCLDVTETEKRRITDDYAMELMQLAVHCDSATAFQALPPEEREMGLRALLEAGASIRQTSMLTGISIGIVRKYTK